MSKFADDPYTDAHQRGLDVVLPGPQEVLLDIDNDASRAWMNAMLNLLGRNGVSARVTKTTVSPGGNTHAYVTLDRTTPLTDIERLCLQACMGSDRTRELLSLLRLWNGVHPASVLFEKPSSVGLEAAMAVEAVEELPF